jgi:glycosyltransferase involved in cell wall biosynthesis
METPALSVVISAHARPVELREAIAAVVDQDLDDVIETIVVFDKAEPDMSLVSDDPRRPVRVIPNEHGNGLPGSRNAGADRARAEVIGFCDDDDLWLPQKARRQLQVMAERDADVVTSGIELLSADRIVRKDPPGDTLTFSDLLRSRRVEACMVSAIVRRSAFLGDEIGPMDESIPGGFAEDYEFMLRAARHGEVAVVAEPLVRVRWGAPSHFRDRWRTIDDALAYLLARFPEFRTDRVGLARVEGQRAFAQAAARRKGCWRQICRVLRLNPLERRAWLAIPVAARLISASRIVNALNARGRGI